VSEARIWSPAAHFGRVPEVLLYGVDVSDAECRLYAHLTMFDWKRTGKVWPGREACAKALDWSVSKVDRYMKLLESRGAIEQQRQGQGNPNLIILAADLESPDLRSQESSPLSLESSDPEIAPLTNERKNERGTKLADPFLVDDMMQAWVKKEAPHVDWELETKRFCNYFRGEGTAKKDWRATWRNWMLKAESQLPAWARR
jgi:hypothetical protein